MTPPAWLWVVYAVGAWLLGFTTGAIFFNPKSGPEPPTRPPASTPASTPLAPEPEMPNAENTTLSDNLNAADGMFKAGMDGCGNVSIAIGAANSPEIFGRATDEQRAELKRYAARCNLLY